ncbi:phage baseplate assembly protein V [Escherichia coli]
MNTLANIQELARALRNMIRTGLVVETDLNAGRCRVQTGGMCTDWLQWLTHRAGRSRTWWAPSVGEQVLILAVGGELDTAFVLPGIYSGDNPAPSASADALHIRFPDGAVIEYEPETSALTVLEKLGVINKESDTLDQTAARTHAATYGTGGYIPATSSYAGYQAYQPVTAPAGRSYVDQSKNEYHISLTGGTAPGTQLDRQLQDALEKYERDKRARARASMMHDG